MKAVTMSVFVIADLHIKADVPSDRELDVILAAFAEASAAGHRVVAVFNGDVLDLWRNSLESRVSARVLEFFGQVAGLVDSAYLIKGTTTHDGTQLETLACISPKFIYVRDDAVFLIQHPDADGGKPVSMLALVANPSEAGCREVNQDTIKTHPLFDTSPFDLVVFHRFTDRIMKNWWLTEDYVAEEVCPDIGTFVIGGHMHSGFDIGNLIVPGIYSPRNFKDIIRSDDDKVGRFIHTEWTWETGNPDPVGTIRIIQNPYAVYRYLWNYEPEKDANFISVIDSLIKIHGEFFNLGIRHAPTEVFGLELQAAIEQANQPVQRIFPLSSRKLIPGTTRMTVRAAEVVPSMEIRDPVSYVIQKFDEKGMSITRSDLEELMQRHQMTQIKLEDVDENPE